MIKWSRWVSIIAHLPDDRVILTKRIYNLYDTVDNWSVSFNTLLKTNEDPLAGAGEIFRDIFNIDTASYSDSDVEITRLKPILLGRTMTKISVFLTEFKKSTSFRVNKDMMVIAKPADEVNHLIAVKPAFFSFISEQVIRDLMLREDF